MYEAFMADYGLIPDEADECFSLRQMSLLLAARLKRKKAESKITAHEIWDAAFGESSNETNENTMIPFIPDKPKSMSFFGIKSPNERR